MKQLIFLNLLMLLSTQTFAASNTQTSNNSSSQPIILLGEINDQSPGAESYEPRVPPPINKLLQEQNTISAAYDQKQEEITEEEDYFDEMNDFGMFGEPFGGYGDMYAGPSMMIPIAPVNNSSSINYVKPKPKLNKNYESQLPNGDIIFKQ